MSVRRAVVLATGGFGGSVERLNDMCGRRSRTPWRSPAPPATACGWRTRPAPRSRTIMREPAFWAPVSETAWLDGGRGAFPASVARPRQARSHRGQCGGRRFVDEALSYHEFVMGCTARMHTVPTIPAWLMCDREFIAKYGLGRIPRDGAAGGLHRQRLSHRGGDVDALARKIGVDAAGLREAVAGHNRFAETGEDQDFGKGSTDSTATTAIRDHGPIHASARSARALLRNGGLSSTLGSSVGLRRDADGRVLTARGEPIPGLFVAATTWRRSCAATVPGLASRSGLAWFSLIGPQWRSQRPDASFYRPGGLPPEIACHTR